MTDSNYSNYRPEVDLAADKIDEYLKNVERTTLHDGLKKTIDYFYNYK